MDHNEARRGDESIYFSKVTVGQGAFATALQEYGIRLGRRFDIRQVWILLAFSAVTHREKLIANNCLAMPALTVNIVRLLLLAVEPYLSLMRFAMPTHDWDFASVIRHHPCFALCMHDLHDASLEFLILLMKSKQYEVARAAHTGKQPQLIAELHHVERRLRLEFRYRPKAAASED